MTELLTFEQRLRMECFKMTLDVEKAQEAYDYILGTRRAHQPVGEEPSEDTDRFLTDYPFTNLLEDEGLSIRANNILRVNEIATLVAEMAAIRHNPLTEPRQKDLPAT